MSKVIPREQVRKLLLDRFAGQPGFDPAAIESRLATALKAARLADKPAYRPEEVAALGQALMQIALEDVSAGLARLDPGKADSDA